MTLCEIKQCSIGVLDYIDEICKNNNLVYFLSGGTLLGAVRHQGFIPWDDDIDIMMPRHDYEQLFKIWPKDSSYEILNFRNHKYFPYAYSKVYDKRTVKYEKNRRRVQMGGIDVDVFPIDNLPDEKKETERYFHQIEQISRKLFLHIQPFHGMHNRRDIKDNLRTFYLRMDEYLGHSSIRKYTLQFDKLARKYDDDGTSYCGVTALSHYGPRERNPKSIFSSAIPVTFEGKQYPAPVGYKQYLAQLYGDNYMQLPPMEMRVPPHGYQAYWK